MTRAASAGADRLTALDPPVSPSRTGHPGRRTVVGGLLALSAAACSPGSGSDKPSKPDRADVSADQDGHSGARVMQIVAHPDDDLYFMNPELAQSIAANDQLISVYLNCGETGGVNKVPGSRTAPKPDVAAYAGARRQGLRQAYAYMATGKAKRPWKTEALTLPDGTQVELDTLDGHPGLQLVFLGIRQHTSYGSGPSQGLPELWADPSIVTSTLVSTGSPVRDSHKVTRDSVIAALAHLLDRYRPTLVRTMDPDPDMQVHDAAHRAHHDQPGYSDHPDHTATALFTLAALDRYQGPGQGRPYSVVSYRGYYNERWPQNLPEELVRAKADVLNVYGGSPDGCAFAAGCGDYDVGKDRSYGTGWLQRTSVRRPAAPALHLDGEGRLTAFAVLGGRPALWRENAKGGGTWPEPVLFGADRLLPGLSANLTRDGRWQLFAQRIASLGPSPSQNTREIVTTEQRTANGPFGAWSGLGNPERDPDHGRRVGAPVVARDGDGQAVVFVRTWSKGIAMRRQQSDGRWSAWRDLGGAEVQEGLTAVTDALGRVHVLASGHDTVHHWTQDEPGGAFALSPTGLPAPADPPTATAGPDGTLTVAFREASTSRPLLGRLPGGEGTWRIEHPGLSARGYGPLAVLAHGDEILLAARNNNGTTSTATWRPGGKARWTTVPHPVAGTQVLASDAQNRPVLAHLSPDATLRISPASKESKR
ncbi:PIG-L family deacetylase [Streptomyces xanthochromogenes]|uniref:PIG-L family deacetylase n=1 Tax=Streptomyces xanthochromogenes TaxID=67384 RepID=UPI002F42B22F